jgi:uncharacterized protein YndB with AHSA1/START domain
MEASVTKSREDDQMTETTKRITVSVSHTYTASPERVFDAWVDSKKAAKFFFATETGEVVRCEIDARVGGTFTVVDRRDGKDVLHTGKYIEVERSASLGVRLRGAGLLAGVDARLDRTSRRAEAAHRSR